MGLRKINTIGIGQANKVMHMTACAYNLKELMKFVKTDVETMVGTAIVDSIRFFGLYLAFPARLGHLSIH